MPAVPARATSGEPDGVNAVLLGPPGSGKGTQVCLLSVCFSTQDRTTDDDAGVSENMFQGRTHDLVPCITVTYMMMMYTFIGVRQTVS
jgi:hypothetical protein